MKKFFATVLSLAMALSLMACGAEPATSGSGSAAPAGEDGYELALVTDVGNIDDKSFNQGAWEGVVSYADDTGVSYNYYRPSEDSTAARVETIGSAIDGGAKIVVCPGYLFEEAIYQVQETYPDTQFLLLDGEPHSSDYEDDTIASNVHCILYRDEQAGYLAGYAAVMEGYRNLGFCGGMAVPAVIRYGYGFIQGADVAAQELGETVNMNYYYANAFTPSDDLQTKMAGWYADGTECVFACGGGLYLSVLAAAEAAEATMIGVDVDQSAESDRIITSAVKELSHSVVLSLTALYDNGLVWPEEYAGTTGNLGAAEDCVGLPTADTSWRLQNYTVDQYTELFGKIASGEVEISSDTETQPATTAVTVDYQG